ncbi:MAG: molybdenum cofactor guanylyltransferase MobA [Aquabacterium sp.]
MTTPIRAEQITGLLLAGGRGSRLGGVDKGLQPWRGQPLAGHVLRRLMPQVGQLMINANRHAEIYAGFGVPVWPDADGSFAGPLAGFLAGLRHCSTPWLVTVPCDTPLFPTDLVARLARAASEADAEVAMATAPDDASAGAPPRPQPVFCLLRATLRDSLEQELAAGGRKIDRWTSTRRQVLVPFSDAAAFFNVNTPDDLAALQDR